MELVREEGVSGAKPLDNRPGGKQLLSLVGWRKIKHVVALKLDRLFRDAQDALHQTRKWDQAGMALHAFAELERNLIAERTAAALAHKKSHLQVYGPVPYGFKRAGDRLVNVKAEQAIIQQMRLARASGLSFCAIANQLNEQGVKTKAGGRRWYASTIQKLIANDLHASEDVPEPA